MPAFRAAMLRIAVIIAWYVTSGASEAEFCAALESRALVDPFEP